ncbi:FitA-like ribbon-helix-helix domain-containing protein [Candidatus Poriferisodalis sp.]|uniref:type II toxin-antitoxin system VapB family antitoxin n=1 Tax=Candidatus Poriferisodalis sp. TaxID=3101277 RepID=UPI003B52E343
MTDILIRNVPDEVVAAVDANAKQAQLSRVEYLRRLLERERARTEEVTAESLRRFNETFADLADPDVMQAAWS